MPTLRTDLTLNVSNFVSNMNKSVLSASKLGSKLASVASESSAAYSALAGNINKTVSTVATGTSENAAATVPNTGATTVATPVINTNNATALNKQASAASNLADKMLLLSQRIDTVTQSSRASNRMLSIVTAGEKVGAAMSKVVASIKSPRESLRMLGATALNTATELISSADAFAVESRLASGAEARIYSLTAALNLLKGRAALTAATVITGASSFSLASLSVNNLKAKIASLNINLGTLKNMFNKAAASAESIKSRLLAPFSSLITKLKSASLSLEQFSNNLRRAGKSGSDNINKLSGNVKSLGLNLKSAANIAAGIAISQIFYAIVSSVKSATSAIVTFYAELENAKLIYTNFMGSADLAENFTNVLKDFAAQTPISFEAATSAAQRLLSYGIQYKNLMYVIKGTMSAASAFGDDSKMETITRALGQIYTKGKVKAEELRQLAEAGIPAYEILRTKLGLTAKEISNIGNANISASTAINALVEGMNERYGNLIGYTNKTLKGLLENIRDIGLQLSASIFEPLILGYKKVLAGMVNGMQNMKNTYDATGLGGLFESMIPKSLQGIVRNLIASLMDLIGALKVVKDAIGAIINAVGPQLLPLINAFVTACAQVVIIIGAVISYITNSTSTLKTLSSVLAFAAKMWLLFKMYAFASAVVATVAKLLSKAIIGIANALSIVVAHPAITFFILLGVAVAALMGKLGALKNAITGIASSMKTLGGIDSSKILLPEQKERNADLDKFNQELDTTANNMDDTAKSTSAAANAAKALASFDEVFNLNTVDSTKGTGTGADDDVTSIPSIELPSDTDLGSALPSLDTDSWLDGMDKKFQGVLKALKDKLKALFGDDSIGTIVQIALAAAIALGIGKAFKMIPEAIAAAAILGVGIAIKNKILKELGKKLKISKKDIEDTSLVSSIATTVGFAILACITGVSLPLAALLAAVAGLAAGVLDLIKPAFDEWISDPDKGGNIVDGMALGTAIGAGIGLVLGGPGGAIIGAAIGALVGGLIGRITTVFGETDWGAQFSDLFTFDWALDWFNAAADSFSDAWDALKSGDLVEFCADVVEGIGDGIVGAIAFMVEPIAKFFSKTFNLFKKVFGINSPAKKMKPIGKYIVQGIGKGFSLGMAYCLSILGQIGTSIVKNVSSWSTDVVKSAKKMGDTAGSNIVDFATNAASSIGTFASDTYTSIKNWATGSTDEVKSFSTSSSSRVARFKTKSSKSMKDFTTTSYDSLKKWNTQSYDKVSTFATHSTTKFATWNATNKKKVKDFSSSSYTYIKDWKTKSYAKVKSFSDDSYSKLSTWNKKSKGNFTDFKNSTYATTKDWKTGTYSKVKDFVTDSGSKLQTFYNNQGKFTTFSANTGSTIGTWATNLSSTVTTKFGEINKALADFLAYDGKTVNVSTNAVSTWFGTDTTPKFGHAGGGIFNREHVAKFAEGNKKEAIIPLENKTGMQPFVDAVSSGITSTLGPIVASLNNNNQSSMQPVYVGTLIADERGLKELNRKMQVIQIKEDGRRS